LRFKQHFNQDTFAPKVIQQATTSPNGEYLVFNAVGYLWKKKLPNGKPIRLTKGNDFEFDPSFSFDGKNLIYVTWNDTSLGRICKLDFSIPDSEPEILSKDKGIYRNPSFAPDGNSIVYLKEEGDEILGFNHTVNPGIYTMTATGTNIKLVIDHGSAPFFNHTGDRIYFQTENSLSSCKTDGSNERLIFKSTYGSQFRVSPDGKWVGFVDLHQGYLAAFPSIGKNNNMNC